MDHHNLCYGCMEERGTSKTCPYCGLPADAGPESALHLPPGTILQDKYLLGRALGQGGFGITYLAWDKILKIKLAIKEYLPQQLAYRTDGSTKVSVYKQSLTEEFSYGREKFLEEAQTLARFIEHPNVVSVRDYFEANGTAYLVMHYHEGVTLQNYLASRGGKIPVDRALPIFMPVLDALREVHTAGILHRDISPDNLLIDKTGRVVLIDFGAARQAMGEKSRSLSVIMKAGYSPEEQYRSRGKQGPWSDIYAVAATMYRAVTGQAPPESMDRLADDDMASPSQLGIEISREQEEALLKALAVKVEDRFQVVEDFQAALLQSAAADSKPEDTADKLEKDNGAEPGEKARKLGEQEETPEKSRDVYAGAGKQRPVERLSAAEGINEPATPVTAEPNSGRAEKTLVDLNCPVEMVTYKIEPLKEAEETLIAIEFQNLTQKTIEALRISIFCFNPFGEPVNVKGDNEFKKNLLDLAAGPGERFGQDLQFKLKDFDDTRRVSVIVNSVIFTDDSRWDRDGSMVYEITTRLVLNEENDRLKKVAGSASLCYASETRDYWQCSCGRANLHHAEKCLRCGNVKAFVLKHASSKEDVMEELTRQEEARRRKQSEKEHKEQLIREEQEKEEKRRKVEAEIAELKRRGSLTKEAEERALKHHEFLAKTKKAGVPLMALLAVLLVVLLANVNNIRPAMQYNRALNLMKAGDFIAAAEMFEDLADYKDAEYYFKRSTVIPSLTSLDADCYIDDVYGTIPLGELPIGARVVDPSWEWEFRTGRGYAREEGDQIKPVTWIVVAHDHYDGLDPHVTLLSEELIGQFPFDDSTDRDHEYAERGYNHWGESGTGNATSGLRPWLNSTGIHSDEGFYRAFSESFKSAVLTTTVSNREWEDGRSYSTSDHVFMPSTTGLNDEDHNRTYPIGRVYAYFAGAGAEERVARLGGDARSYWTRSPNTRYGDELRYISPAGVFRGSDRANSDDRGVRPALNLKSDTLVSEIRNDDLGAEVDSRGLIVITDGDDLLAPVNKQTTLKQDYEPGDLQPIPDYMAPPRPLQLREPALRMLIALWHAASSDGVNLQVISAYRSYDYQAGLFQRYVDSHGEEEANRSSARPGQSEHQLGTTVDFGGSAFDLKAEFAETKQGQWLVENAYYFGFVMSYPRDSENITGYIFEPWHYRYIGVEAALEWKNSGVTLTEFLMKKSGYVD